MLVLCGDAVTTQKETSARAKRLRVIVAPTITAESVGAALGAVPIDVLLAETLQHRARLAKRLEADDLLCYPNPDDLYVWQLQTTRQHRSMGSTSESKYTTLCLTENLAWEHAACELKKAEMFGSSHNGGALNDKLVSLFDAGRFREVAEISFGDFHFEVHMVPIHADAKPSEYVWHQTIREDDDG